MGYYLIMVIDYLYSKVKTNWRKYIKIYKNYNTQKTNSCI